MLTREAIVRALLDDEVDPVAAANAMYTAYRAEFGFADAVPLGHSQIVAGLVCCRLLEAEPVGGYAVNDTEATSHWWTVLPDGSALDPLGGDWPGGAIRRRKPFVRGIPALISAIRRDWSDAPLVLNMTRWLQQGRDLFR